MFWKQSKQNLTNSYWLVCQRERWLQKPASRSKIWQKEELTVGKHGFHHGSEPGSPHSHGGH